MFRTLATSGFALVAGAAPLFADVTPAEVWQSLTENYTRMGYEVVTGSQDDRGDTLILNEVQIRTSPDEAGMTFTIPQITFSQTGDARVRGVIEGDMSGQIAMAGPDGEPDNIHMLLTAPGNEMVSHGEPDDLTNAYTYPTLGLSVWTEGAPEGDAPITLTLTDITGTETVKRGDGIENTYDFNILRAVMNVALEVTESDDGAEGEPAAEGRFVADFEVGDIVATGRSLSPEQNIDISTQMTAALAAGLTSDGKIVTGPITGSFRTEGQDEAGQPQTVSGTYAAENSEIDAAISAEGLSYKAVTGPMTTEMSLPTLDVPITYSVESGSGAFEMPLVVSQEAQPYRLSYALEGLTMGDGLWNLFDPGQELPRDPARIEIDLEGLAQVTGDILDPAYIDTQTDPEFQQEPPILPQTLTINRFVIDAAGFASEVTGDLAFNPGAVQPAGQISGSFNGLNTLIERLMTIGVIPQEQAMGARMMIAMFFKPVENDPDHLQATIELRDDGSIFANGQQIR